LASIFQTILPAAICFLERWLVSSPDESLSESDAEESWLELLRLTLRWRPFFRLLLLRALLSSLELFSSELLCSLLSGLASLLFLVFLLLLLLLWLFLRFLWRLEPVSSPSSALHQH
jgi:hypothetical protein